MTFLSELKNKINEQSPVLSLPELSHIAWVEQQPPEEIKVDSQYEWTEFYEAAANALLKYKENRLELLDGLNDIFKKIGLKNPLIEKLADGIYEAYTDICPFAVFGLFNKYSKDEKRILIMKELAILLDIEVNVPTSFDGIHV